MLRKILSEPTVGQVVILFVALWAWPAGVGCAGLVSQTDPELNQVQGDKGDDPEAEVESKRKFWVEVAKRDVADIAKLTDNWPVSVAFVEEIESHFAAYTEIERKILEEFEAKLAKDPESSPLDRSSKPKPELFISTVLESAAYKNWCKDQKVDPESWIRRLARLRGLLGAKSLRKLFDVSHLRKQLDDLLATDLGIPPSTLQLLVRDTEVRIRVSPSVLKVLDDYEPKWGEEELRVHTSYASDLDAFLLDPKKSPFKKKDVDRRIEEEARKKAEEKPSERPEEE